jgi:hypothetical protein
MKKWIVFLLLLNVTISYSQKTDELIQKHIQAIGGEKAWAGIKSIKIDGVITMEGMSIKTTKQVIKNIGYRNDMLFEGKIEAYTNNKYYVSIYNDQGWKYLPDSKDNKPEMLEANEIILYKEDMDYEDPFIFYKEKGTQFTFLNIENILEKDYYKFSAKYKSGNQEYIYLNASDFMIAKRVQTNSEAEDAKEYSEYEKLTSGIWYPKHIKTTIGDIHIEKIMVNPLIDEKIFLPSK